MARDARRGSRGKELLSNQAVSEYLECSREEVLRLELTDEAFPRHVIVRGYLYWDPDEVEEWAEEGGWFDEQQETDPDTEE